MPTRIGDKWFEHKRIDDDITLIWEPYVDPLGKAFEVLDGGN